MLRKLNLFLIVGNFFAALFFVFLFSFSAKAATPEEIEAQIAQKNEEIKKLEQQIAEYNRQLAEKRQSAATLQSEISRLTLEIKKSELEIRSLQLSIENLDLQIKQTSESIRQLEEKINNGQKDLAKALYLIEKSERKPNWELFLNKTSLSAFINDLYDLYFLQDSIKAKIRDFRKNKENLTQMKEKLEDELAERTTLKNFEEMAKNQNQIKRDTQKKLLAQVKKEENQLVNKVKMTEIDLNRIKEQITYLIKAGISVEDAIRYGQLAAIRLGIRPAFLIALLDVESRLGLNVGTGNWREDMHPRDQQAFLEITTKLNLDPDKTPVSKKPKYGWGGAMGPAQFLPNTWLAYESEVARLTGHNPPSPWNIEDAFTAAAIKLARAGATSKTREGEIAAAKAYISGSSSCQKPICNYYANLVLDKAADIEDDLAS